jgi:hypothetical protein
MDDDDGGESGGHGDYFGGTGGILSSSSHLSCKGCSYADAATDSTGMGGTYAGWALNFSHFRKSLCKQGWMAFSSQSYRGQRRGDALSLVVLTAGLFG